MEGRGRGAFAGGVAAGVIASLAMLGGCRTLDSPDDAGAPGTGRTTLLIAEPQGEGWREITSDSGTFHVKAVDGMADVVVIYAVTSTPAGGAGIRNLDQLDAYLEIAGDERYADRRRREILGVPAIFFESARRDDGEGFEVIRKALGRRPRPSGYRYAIREKGVFLLHPGKPGSIVRIGCARNSYHGLLGTHFEKEAEFFLQQFIADNYLEPVSPDAPPVMPP